MERQRTSRGFWRFLESPPQDAYRNMALDEAIHIACSRGVAPPTVRFYCWSSPAISIGYAQRLSRSVDVERCAEQGVTIVRRPTGGRAILHENELTYSVVWTAACGQVPQDLLGSYRMIGRALLKGLGALGIRAEMAPPASGERRRGSRSAACFLTSTAYEILVDGKKVVGSAQRRDRDAVLQQGSILITVDVKRLFSLLRPPSPEEWGRHVDEVSSVIGSLSGLVGEDLSFDGVRDAFREGFAAELAGGWYPGELSPYERGIAERLVVERYATREWTNRR